ncbi:hypothetical protein ACIQNU_02400 [Streptomyces sp. NPDC091292]|uniref:hypothetical protein n=1 Tax=Streptomyces sp. NPDC091292 TaxID=3365991 RepID=UPI0038055BAA
MEHRIRTTGQQPSPMARALTSIATALDLHATRTHPLGGTWQPCMTTGWLTTLTPTIISAHLPGVPYRDRAGFTAAVRLALPPVTGTIAEYAARLRATAATA